jgi:glucokinase
MNETNVFIGIDIGGTKTAISAGNKAGEILDKKRFPTDRNLKNALDDIFRESGILIEKYGAGCAALGVSCGGPLDSGRGLIQSPPNLPGWDNVPLIEMLGKRFSLPAFIENDANACALAEWRYGAGRGSQNMVFLTFGTGLGAGLILGGNLYRGANGLAGEVGHIRMSEEGPLGYGKKGSLEGWCSGGGLSEAYFDLYRERISGGEVCIRAEHGDTKALKVIEKSAFMLGRFLALLIDIINPDRIVIGSIFARSEALFRGSIEEILRKECLPQTAAACSIHPSSLGESLGDIAALSVAANGLDQRENFHP